MTKIGRVTAALLVAAGLGLGSGVTGLAHAGDLHGGQRVGAAVGAPIIGGGNSASSGRLVGGEQTVDRRDH